MRWFVLVLALAAVGCTDNHSGPTGAGSPSPTGAGPQPGASAGASVGGGPAGTGTTDSAGGAK